jgi:hypothetical protein
MHKLPVILFVLMIFLIVGCSAVEPTPELPDPAEVYWEYWTYCDEGREEKAELLLTPQALRVSEQFGVCSFMHDYSLTIGQFPGFNELLLSFIDVEPEVAINDDSATLTWFSDEGMVIPMITMKLVDGEWKIDQIIVMT